jgi:hypothetical protein
MKMKKLYLLLFFSVLFCLPLINAQTPVIFYNFTHPEGVGGNPHLIWNDGSGASGVVQKGNYFYNLSADNLNDTLILEEVTPIGLQNVYNIQHYPSFIDTNEDGLNTNENLSYSIWVKKSVSLVPYAYTSEITPLLNIETINNSLPFLDFYLTDNVYHYTYQSSSLTFSFGIRNGDTTTCSTPAWNDNKYHQVGFIYNEANRLSGNLTSLYIDGIFQKGCENTGLSGLFNMSQMEHFIIGARSNVDYYGQLVLYPYGTNTAKIHNINLFDVALTSEDMIFLNASSYFNGSASGVILILGFDDYYNITNNPITLQMSNHFTTNYDYIKVHFPQPYLNNGTNYYVDLIKKTDNLTNLQYNGTYNFTLISDGTYQTIGITPGRNQTYNAQITITANNSYGSASDYFAVYNLAGTNYSGNGTVVSVDIFGNIIKTFSGIFPDKNDLSGAERFSYVLVVIILLTIGILIIGKEHMELALILSAILDILAFIYFIFIGYVNMGIVIIIVLIGAMVSYIKFRKRT